MSSPSTWNLEALRSYARANSARSDQISELLNSIAQSIQIFRYHMTTARDALNGIVNDAEPQGPENFMLIFGVSERQDDFAFAKIVSEANIIACLYTTRNIWDLFAQLVNVLVLEKPLPVSACDIQSVFAAMPPSALTTRLHALLQSHWYKYVAAFSNTTKHRQLVQHSMTVSMVENRAGIRLGGFAYGKNSFSAYWGQEVLEGAIEIKNAIIECGRILNTTYIGHDAQPIVPGDAPTRGAPLN